MGYYFYNHRSRIYNFVRVCCHCFVTTQTKILNFCQSRILPYFVSLLEVLQSRPPAPSHVPSPRQDTFHVLDFLEPTVIPFKTRHQQTSKRSKINYSQGTRLSLRVPLVSYLARGPNTIVHGQISPRNPTGYMVAIFLVATRLVPIQSVAMLDGA
jgi:hypothetical protein